MDPAGVILPITERLIEDAAFGDCVKAVTEQMDVATGTSFRCFVYPLSITYWQFLAACEGKSSAIPLNEGLALIQENIHHAPFSGPDDLSKEVFMFLANEDRVKNYYSAVRLRLDFLVVVGNLMQTLAIASHVVTIGLGLLLMEKLCAKVFPSVTMPLHDRAMALLDTAYLPIIMLAFSICFIFCITNIIYWFKGLSRYRDKKAALAYFFTICPPSATFMRFAALVAASL